MLLPQSLPGRLGDGHPLPPTQPAFMLISSSPRKTSEMTPAQVCLPFSCAHPCPPWPAFQGTSCSKEKLPVPPCSHSQFSIFPRRYPKGPVYPRNVHLGDLMGDFLEGAWAPSCGGGGLGRGIPGSLIQQILESSEEFAGEVDEGQHGREGHGGSWALFPRGWSGSLALGGNGQGGLGWGVSKSACSSTGGWTSALPMLAVTFNCIS